MAEFCLECWNQLNDFCKTERDYVLSKELDLCEGCGEIRQVIVRERSAKWLYDLNKKRKHG